VGLAVTQASFAGGELTPSLYGRSDISKYPVACKRLRNFFVGPQGQAMSRPGTFLAAEVKTSSAGPVRLIPFVYSDTQTYVLEFGNQYIRVYKNGAQVLSGGVPYEVPGSIPYTTSDLPNLQVSQVGKVLTITRQGRAPAELSWGGSDTSWTWGNISFTRPTPLTLESLDSWLAGPLYQAAGAWSNATTYSKGAYATSGGATYRSLGDTNLNHAVTDGNWWLNVGAAVPEARGWDFSVTLLVQGTNGSVFETLAERVTVSSADGGATTSGLPGTVVIDQDHPVVWGLSWGSTFAALNPIKGARFYRGRSGVMGLVGQVSISSGTTASWLDIGDEPDFTTPPPAGTDPFAGTGVVFGARRITIATGDYPATSAVFEERRSFAGMAARKETLLLSGTGDYYNFDSHAFAREDSPLQFDLAERKLEEVRSLACLQRWLCVFTSSSVWTIAGANGAPLAADSVDAKRQVDVGASWLRPLSAEGALVYVRALGTGVRDLSYSLERGGVESRDLSLLSQHLFLGHTIVDWAYQQHPWSVVWAVRDDGVMLSFTYNRAQDMWAWAWHDTDGAFESVCTVPESTEDAVYVVVRRTINGVTKRYVERMASRVLTKTQPYVHESSLLLQQGVAVDCAGAFQPGSATISGLSWLEGKTVSVVSELGDMGTYTVSGGTVTLSQSVAFALVGLKYTPQVQQLRLALPAVDVKLRQKQVTRVGFEVDGSRGIKVGQDFNHLDEWLQRQVSDSYAAIGLQNTFERVYVAGDWGADGAACLQQDAPFPVTVLAITREVDLGD
jgi:hypothetical protein